MVFFAGFLWKGLGWMLLGLGEELWEEEEVEDEGGGESVWWLSEEMDILEVEELKWLWVFVIVL